MKRSLIAPVILLCIQYSFAQTPTAFTLTGKLSGVHMDSVLIAYGNAVPKYIRESYPISANGEFTIKGDVARPTSSTITFKNKGEVLSSRARELRIKNIYL